MSGAITLGIDVGSTYTKGVLLDASEQILGRAMEPTGYRLAEVAELVAARAAHAAGITLDQVDYTIATGFGRHQVPFRDLHVTDLTAAARGARLLHPATRTVLDIGGQTMKACRLDETGRVETFRLNDKCAAGTGAFLEKTARYMGHGTDEIGALLALAKQPVAISGVCAVFAESEVISHLSQGVPPEDIMAGAVRSLSDRCLQLLRRIRAEPAYALIGGILRWPQIAALLAERLESDVEVAPGALPQFVGALGCAKLGHRRLERRRDATTQPLPAKGTGASA